jgi:hypothetical protein
MNMVVAVSVLTFLALGVCLGLLVRSFRLTAGKLPVTTDWLDDLSADRYRPMLRSLDEGDFRFLSRQPGFDRQMAARLRAQRLRMVREYVRSMEVDFGRLCTALKIVMAQAGEDRPDLAVALIQNQVAFTFGMAAVQVRLLLYRWGLGGMEFTSLLKVFEGMRLELRNFVPAQAAARA